jgi:MOSC domain-containing protein YiiM
VEVPEVECIAGRGLRGDRYLDFRKNYKGQITFFPFEVFEKLCANFGIHDKPAGVLRRNLIVSGVDLLSLIGREFEIQGIRFHGTQHCAPCEWMNVAFAPGAEQFLKDNAGLRAQIFSDGMITLGEARLSILPELIQT